MYCRSINSIGIVTGFATVLGACVPPGGESGRGRSNPSPVIPSPVTGQPPQNPADAGVADAGMIRIRVGQPLRNPDNARPTIDNSNSAFVLDGTGYLCPARPAVSRASGPSRPGARAGEWTLSIENCRPAPDGPEESANVRYLQAERGMAHPYAVVLGEPITRPYSPDAGDDDSLPWTIRPYVDPAGNIYVIQGAAAGDRLYCPRIPEVRFTGTGIFVRNNHRYPVIHHSIGTNVCFSRGSIEQNRRIWEENAGIDAENGRRSEEDRRRADEDRRRTDEETQGTIEESRRREGISGLASGNLVLYGIAAYLNLILFRLLRKDRS